MSKLYNKTFAATLLALGLFASSSSFAAQKTSEAKELAEMSFESARRDNKDHITLVEVEEFRNSLFLSMDQNDSNSLSFDEYFEWDYGFKLIAEQQGKQKEYLTALKIIFALWDLNGDQSLTNEEHKAAMVTDFKRSDLNNNAKLEKSEFLGAFSINIALRAALKD